jgi:hypothetical protein
MLSGVEKSSDLPIGFLCISFDSAFHRKRNQRYRRTCAYERYEKDPDKVTGDN